MQYIIGVAGLALVFGMAFIVSNDRKKIKYRPILTMLVLQFVLGFLLLNTSAGKSYTPTTLKFCVSSKPKSKIPPLS